MNINLDHSAPLQNVTLQIKTGSYTAVPIELNTSSATTGGGGGGTTILINDNSASILPSGTISLPVPVSSNHRHVIGPPQMAPLTQHNFTNPHHGGSIYLPQQISFQQVQHEGITVGYHQLPDHRFVRGNAVSESGVGPLLLSSHPSGSAVLPKLIQTTHNPNIISQSSSLRGAQLLVSAANSVNIGSGTVASSTLALVSSSQSFDSPINTMTSTSAILPPHVILQQSRQASSRPETSTSITVPNFESSLPVLPVNNNRTKEQTDHTSLCKNGMISMNTSTIMIKEETIDIAPFENITSAFSSESESESEEQCEAIDCVEVFDQNNCKIEDLSHENELSARNRFKKRGRGKAKVWVPGHLPTHDVNEIRKYMKKLGFRIESRSQASDGVKFYYKCKVNNCWVRAYILFCSHASTCKLFWEEDVDHNHSAEIVRGMSREVKRCITDLFSIGVQRPRDICLALEKQTGVEIQPRPIVNYFTNLRKKLEEPQVSKSNLQRWVDERRVENVKSEEADVVFVGGFEFIDSSNEQHQSSTSNKISDKSDVKNNEPSYRIFLTSRRLMRNSLRCKYIHVDTAYSVVWRGYLLIVIGVSDQSSNFHPIGVCVSTDEREHDFKFIFQSIKSTLTNPLLKISVSGKNVPPDIFSPSHVICSPNHSKAISNAFRTVFGYKVEIVLCWSKVFRLIEEECVKIGDSTIREELIEDIHHLRMLSNPTKLQSTFNLLTDKWKNRMEKSNTSLNSSISLTSISSTSSVLPSELTSDNSCNKQSSNLIHIRDSIEGVINFLQDFLAKDFITSPLNTGWFHGHAPRIPSTNDPLHSHNSTVRNLFGYECRLGVQIQQFLSILESEIVHVWSVEEQEEGSGSMEDMERAVLDDNGIHHQLTDTEWMEGYTWAKSEFKALKSDNKYYLESDTFKSCFPASSTEDKSTDDNVATSNFGPTVLQYITYLCTNFTSFQSFVQYSTSILQVQLPNQNWQEESVCTCATFYVNNVFRCKHVVGMAIRLKIISTPQHIKDALQENEDHQKSSGFLKNKKKKSGRGRKLKNH